MRHFIKGKNTRGTNFIPACSKKSSGRLRRTTPRTMPQQRNSESGGTVGATRPAARPTIRSVCVALDAKM
jgi:hypothetical protein